MIWTMGEMIVEIMRDKVDQPLDKAGVFLGPYPSGAPAIFIDTAARLGQKAGIISGVGCDDFGKNLLDRLNADGVDTSLVLQDPTCSTGCAFVMYFSDGERKFIFHIGKHRPGAHVGGCVGRGDKGEGGNDDVVSRANACNDQREGQRRGAADPGG